MTSLLLTSADAAKWVMHLYKAVSTVSTMVDTYNDYQKDGATIKTAAKAVYIIAQGAEIGCFATGCEPSDPLFFGARVASGASDVGITMADKGLSLDLVTVIAMRAGDILGGAVEAEFIKDPDKYFKEISGLLINVGEIVQKRDDISKLFTLLGGGGYAYLIAPLWACIFGNDKEPEVQGLTPEQLARHAQSWRQQLATLRNQCQNWGDLQQIPNHFRDNPLFKQNTCPISQQPIRFVVIPRETDTEKEDPVCYELARLEEWIASNSNEKPPEWPEELEAPTSANSYRKFRTIQRQIDKSLECVAIKFMQFYDNELVDFHED